MKILNLLNVVSFTWVLFMVPATAAAVGFKAPKLGTAEARVGGGRRGVFKAPKMGTAAARVGGGRRGWAPPKLGTAAARVGGGRRGWAAPKLGTAAARVGGGRRGFAAPKLGVVEGGRIGGARGESDVPEDTAEAGFAEGAPEVWVLTPASAGLTVSASPSLYYYLSDNTGMALDVTINLDRLTLFQLQVNTPKRKGVYKVSLAEMGMQLEEGKEYEWNVVLIPDPAQGSLNITSTGAVKRVPVEKKLEEMLIEKKSNQYEAYAENGIWYEALDELNQKILANPENTKLKTERSDLLKQVGLPSVADMLMQ